MDISLSADDWTLLLLTVAVASVPLIIEWHVRSIYPITSFCDSPTSPTTLISGFAQGLEIEAPLSGRNCLGWTLGSKLPVQWLGTPYVERPGVSSKIVLTLVDRKTGNINVIDLTQTATFSWTPVMSFSFADPPDNEWRFRKLPTSSRNVRTEALSRLKGESGVAMVPRTVLGEWLIKEGEYYSLVGEISKSSEMVGRKMREIWKPTTTGPILLIRGDIADARSRARGVRKRARQINFVITLLISILVYGPIFLGEYNLRMYRDTQLREQAAERSQATGGSEVLLPAPASSPGR